VIFLDTERHPGGVGGVVAMKRAGDLGAVVELYGTDGVEASRPRGVRAEADLA